MPLAPRRLLRARPSRAFLRSLFRFGLVGGGVTLAVYVLFDALTRMGVAPVPASAAGWALGVALGYALNRRFTFELKRGASVREVATFLGGYGLQLVIGFLGYALLMDCWSWPKPLAFVCVTAVTAAFSFLFMRFAVFRPDRDPDRDPGAGERAA